MIGTASASVSKRLFSRIQSAGPITFAEFMRTALYDPDDGYYCRDDVERWGREGDYRTSPERSELFAATFARYFACLYEQLGSPAEWTILEAGAGSGYFARGVLRTLAGTFPEVFAATRYVIDELSPSAEQRCREITKSFTGRVEFARLRDITLKPGVIFSNELLDAFQVHRVTLHGGELKEFYVDANANGEFGWTLKSPSTPRLQANLDLCGIELPERQTIEVNLELENWFSTVAASLKAGFVVSVDYGYQARELYIAENQGSGTLRGFRRHSFIEDVLAEPGGCDLTASVNWTAVEKIGEQHQLEVVSFKRQDKFLIDEGLLGQLEIESRNARTDAERIRLSTDAREMILPDGMAAKFQVMTQQKKFDE
ncbi:MAG TPA: SAM-dependent methyltransferase [Pyrinomonadaceae bacterium]|nr:SAM-dependent methyltransferase [Pyrinomonadaceae bacterium]